MHKTLYNIFQRGLSVPCWPCLRAPMVRRPNSWLCCQPGDADLRYFIPVFRIIFFILW